MRILKIDGAILFALLDNEIVGTAASIEHRGEIFELDKTDVTKKYQGRGIGRKLAETIIDRAKIRGESELYLQSSAEFKIAFNLHYENSSPYSAGMYFYCLFYKDQSVINKLVIAA